MKKLTLLLLIAALPVLAHAQIVYFQATLTGSQEVPPTGSLGFGTATASLDLSNDLFVFNDSWSGLSTPQSLSHIHDPGVEGVNAPVLIPFGLANGFIIGNTFGTVSYTGTLTASQADDLLNDRFYVNVHTTAFPGGEIRGQLLPVPEPSTYALGGVALLGLLAWRRARAKTSV